MTVIIKDRDPRKYQQLLDRHPGLLDRYPRLLDGYPGGGYRGGPIRRPRPGNNPRDTRFGPGAIAVRPRPGLDRPVRIRPPRRPPPVNPRARPRGPGYQGSGWPRGPSGGGPRPGWTKGRPEPRSPRPYYHGFGNRLRAGGRVAGRNKYGTPYPTSSPRPGLPKDGPRPGSMRR